MEDLDHFTQNEMIEILEDNRGHLSKWEESFLDSILEQLDSDVELTPSQEDELREISREYL